MLRNDTLDHIRSAYEKFARGEWQFPKSGGYERNPHTIMRWLITRAEDLGYSARDIIGGKVTDADATGIMKGHIRFHYLTQIQNQFDDLLTSEPAYGLEEQVNKMCRLAVNEGIALHEFDQTGTRSDSEVRALLDRFVHRDAVIELNRRLDYWYEGRSPEPYQLGAIRRFEADMRQSGVDWSEIPARQPGLDSREEAVGFYLAGQLAAAQKTAERLQAGDLPDDIDPDRLQQQIHHHLAEFPEYGAEPVHHGLLYLDQPELTDRDARIVTANAAKNEDIRQNVERFTKLTAYTDLDAFEARDLAIRINQSLDRLKMPLTNLDITGQLDETHIARLLRRQAATPAAAPRTP